MEEGEGVGAVGYGRQFAPGSEGRCQGQTWAEWEMVKPAHLVDCKERDTLYRKFDTRKGARGTGLPDWILDRSEHLVGDLPIYGRFGPFPPWVAGADEENFPLTRRAQRDIWLHQHPPNCSDITTRFLLVKWDGEPESSLADRIATMAKHLAQAMTEGRVLVTGKFDHARHHGCRGGDKFGRWACYFLPETSPDCRARAVKLMARSGGNRDALGDLKLGWEAAQEEGFGQPPDLWGTPWENLPATVEIEGGLKAGTSAAEGKASLWWQAQAARYFVRFPSERLCRKVNIARHAAWGRIAAEQVVTSFQVDGMGRRILSLDDLGRSSGGRRKVLQDDVGDSGESQTVVSEVSDRALGEASVDDVAARQVEPGEGGIGEGKEEESAKAGGATGTSVYVEEGGSGGGGGEGGEGGGSVKGDGEETGIESTEQSSGEEVAKKEARSGQETRVESGGMGLAEGKKSGNGFTAKMTEMAEKVSEGGDGGGKSVNGAREGVGGAGRLKGADGLTLRQTQLSLDNDEGIGTSAGIAASSIQDEGASGTSAESGQFATETASKVLASGDGDESGLDRSASARVSSLVSSAGGDGESLLPNVVIPSPPPPPFPPPPSPPPPPPLPRLEDRVWSHAEAFVPRPMVCVHVDLSKAAQGTGAVSQRGGGGVSLLGDFMESAERVRVRFPHLRNVWLSTQHTEAVLDTSRYPWWTFFYTNATRKIGTISHEEFERRVGWQESTDNSFVDLLLAAQADYFVGTANSAWSSLLDQLRCTSGRSDGGFLAVKLASEEENGGEEVAKKTSYYDV
eukprot:TRINITY_DN2884_c0_g1_i1.p1 TRINITY_DN2884_c0_g1~~TRINITY_DN2884_c0_g1_i1.p1  ORF type:complete len:859 (-),score=198.23 TRINITY_DN2884_c0_g1_i1:586-2973(-)